MRFAWLFLAWVMIEIGLFVTLGGWIGLLWTWAEVLGSGVGGILLIRQQKRTVLGQVFRDLQTLRDPLTPAAHSALCVLAGVLLILPGFLTDFAGLMLLIPWVRNQLIEHLRAKARMAAIDLSVAAMLRPRRADAVDGNVEEDRPETPQPSGWTKP